MTYLNNTNPSQHTPPKFKQEQTVKVPKEVHESEKGVVVGEEWSPANDRAPKKSKTWLYYLKFAGCSDPWFLVTEEELTEWNGV